MIVRVWARGPRDGNRRAGRPHPRTGNGYDRASPKPCAAAPESPAQMPFTLAHPVAVLPFRQLWRGGFVALAIGSMGPDIPYFLPYQLTFDNANTHVAVGAVTWGAGYALALLIAAALLRPVIVAPMWGRHRALVERELGPYSRSAWMWVQAVPAVVIGAAIHFACDSATHRYGWIVDHVSLLRAQLPPVYGHSIAVFNVLQYAGSVLGLLIIAWWYGREIRDVAQTPDRPGPWRATTLISLTAIATFVGSRSAITAGDHFSSVHGRSFIMLTSTITTFVVLYLCFGVLLLLGNLRRS